MSFDTFTETFKVGNLSIRLYVARLLEIKVPFIRGLESGVSVASSAFGLFMTQFNTSFLTWVRMVYESTARLPVTVLR